MDEKERTARCLPKVERGPRAWLVGTLAVVLLGWIAVDAYAQGTGSSGFAIIRAYDGTNIINVGDNANSALRVNVVAGSGAGVSHVDDAPFTVTTDDIVPAGFMFDDASPDSVNEGDAGVGRMSANRNQYITIRDAAGNERGVNVTAANQLEVLAAANNLDIRDLAAATDSVTASLSSSSTANNDGAQVSVTTTSGTVLASFSTRKAATVCSSPLNTDVVHLKLGATATTGDGKLHIGQCWNSGPVPYTGVIDARSAAGTQEVTVWEW
jgi:hypothetical protein